jgi:hypothetical protein
MIPDRSTPSPRRRLAAIVAVCWACCGVTAPVRAVAPAASATPTRTGTVTPLALEGAGPYYTLTVTMALRQTSSLPGLGDLRVRNAAGETMAFAWAHNPPLASPSQRLPATLYKVPAPHLPAAAASAADAPPQAWIVDTREADADLQRLELTLERDTQGVYVLKIEAGDDLQHWRMLQEDAQLVQLQPLPTVGSTAPLATQAERERLNSIGIDLGGAPARYLRLSTAARSGTPPLVGATVIRTHHRQPAPPPLEWSAPIAASACDAEGCNYAMPRNVPLAAVQIAVADVDTIGRVMLLGQMDPGRQAPPHHGVLHDPLHALRLKARRPVEHVGPDWTPIAADNAYWLSQPSGAADLHSPPLRLDEGSWPALRLEAFGPIGQLGHVPPTLRVATHPRTLVFVARGPGPYELVQAGPHDTTAPLALAELMPARQPGDALPADRATPVTATPAPAATPSAPARATAPAPARDGSPWLWAALLAGLAAMGAMAWSLLRRPALAATNEPPADRG